MSTVPKHAAAYLAARPHTRSEVLARPTPVPKSPGVYGWWLRTLPADIDTSNCATEDGLTLLYTGTSPKEPSAGGKVSTSTLRDRINIHYKRNASGSTLRLTLGCLLADSLGIELRRYGSTDRIFFGPGEKVLDEWMGDNALVSWIAHPEPWIVEKQLIGHLDVPLNLRDNENHPFYLTLKAIRDAGREHARSLPNATQQV